VYRSAIEAWLDAVPLRRRVLAFVSAQGLPAYLVGGSVRDALLGRPCCDLDVAIAGGAMGLAKRLADEVHGAYVPLDVEHDVARVVVRVGDTSQHFDLAGLRASDIEADLWARDYTINALAVELKAGWGELLDPTGGQADLAARTLRMVRADAFESDPLRILRGVRLRGVLGFTLTPDTEALARAWLPALQRVSAERVRDELVQVLALENAAESLAYAGGLGVFVQVFPELGDPDGPLVTRAVQRVADLEWLYGSWVGSVERHARGAPLGLQRCVPTHAEPNDVRSILGRYAARLTKRWTEELSSGRTRGVTLKLAAFLSVLAVPRVLINEITQRLHLSVREMRFVEATLRGASLALAWSGEGEPSPLTIYRYFRDLGDAGVEASLLALTISRGETPGSEARAWKGFLGRAAKLLDAWFDAHQALVDPPQLLSGHDLMRSLHITPGPQLGTWLELVREAQVQGLVRTRAEALTYLQAQAPRA
jgi:poly(A) polymerase